MKIKIYPPSLPLAEYIKYFWVLESCCETHTEVIYPTGNIQLLFHYRHPFCNVHANGLVVVQEQFLVSGQKTGYRNVQTYREHGVLGVELHPYAAAAFFPFAMKELTNHDPDLSDIYQDWKDNEWRFLDSTDDLQRIQIVESFLINKLDKNDQSHLRLVRSCLSELEWEKGQIPVHRLGQKYFMSERSLERLFAQQVGISPKKYCEILKFNQAMEQIKSGNSLSLTEIGYQAGYYDQSHFIKICKQYTGHTPSSLRKLCSQ